MSARGGVRSFAINARYTHIGAERAHALHLERIGRCIPNEHRQRQAALAGRIRHALAEIAGARTDQVRAAHQLRHEELRAARF